ncbi:hypothetical protein GCM10025868_15560 [Angustibacter aerolatus]|uniref:Uncharacterized protein n=1 Tax=Angustibacter aerolatus TaxID=1162965 RepID=A0ABQ6JDP5_9ACTN|nr:hypothetical protein GCM10025868_15560 [Angustibacter aerolatus]
MAGSAGSAPVPPGQASATCGVRSRPVVPASRFSTVWLISRPTTTENRGPASGVTSVRSATSAGPVTSPRAVPVPVRRLHEVASATSASGATSGTAPARATTWPPRTTAANASGWRRAAVSAAVCRSVPDDARSAR